MDENEYGTDLVGIELSHISASYELYCPSTSPMLTQPQEENEDTEQNTYRLLNRAYKVLYRTV